MTECSVSRASLLICSWDVLSSFNLSPGVVSSNNRHCLPASDNIQYMMRDYCAFDGGSLSALGGQSQQMCMFGIVGAFNVLNWSYASKRCAAVLGVVVA